MNNERRDSHLYLVGAAVALALFSASPVAAQGLVPPVGGMTALDPSTQQETAGVEVATATAIRGVGHALHFTKRLFVHGGTSGGDHGQSDPQKGVGVTVDNAGGTSAPLMTSTAVKNPN